MRNPPRDCAAPPYEWRGNSCPGMKHITELGWCCDKCGIFVDPPASELKKTEEKPIPVAPGQLKLF